MANHPRWWREDAVYSEVKRTVDRAFLLRPSAEVRNIIGACLGRAQRIYPVKLHWAEANINHMGTGRSAFKGKTENLSHFTQLYYSLLSREINRLLGREGPVWSTKNRSTICVDDEAAEQQMYYHMSNPVKDGLARKVKHWSKISFSSYTQLAEGKKEQFWYINRTAWHRAGGRAAGKRPEDFIEWVDVEFHPLPHLTDMPAHKREEHIRRELRQIEQAEHQKRVRDQRPSITQKRLLKIDPRSRPKTTPKKTRKPLCHASSMGKHDDYEGEWRTFLDCYRTASGQFRRAMFSAEFPEGSFRPPLLDICRYPMRC